MAESNISDIGKKNMSNVIFKENDSNNMYPPYDCSNNGNEDIQNEEQTKSTGDNTISIKKKREKIFEITKNKNKNKNLGRKRKNQDFIKKEKCHTKMNSDNILTKIKTNVLKNILLFINILIKNSENDKIKDFQIKKIHQSSIRFHKKEDNLKLLNKSIKDIFSDKISIKFKNFYEDTNKDNIIYLSKQNEKLNEVFNKTFKEMLEIYCQNKNENSFYKDFQRLNDYKDQEKDLKYFEQYEYYAKNYEKEINSIKSRRTKKKNTILIP